MKNHIGYIRQKSRFWFKGFDNLKPTMIAPQDVLEINYADNYVLCRGVIQGCSESTIILDFKHLVQMNGTNITDSEGQEIFDMDIIKISCPNELLNGRYVVRQSLSGEWRIDRRIDGRTLRFESSYAKVIGNYYENPEIMEEIDFEPYV